MDEIDNKIIVELTKDARTSFRKIAKNLERSPDTIINRFQKLINDGYIRGSTVIVDPHQIGYEGMAAFHIDVDAEEVDPSTILVALIKMPSIIVATKTMGDHDLLALSVIHDFNHLMRLGEDIAAIPGVKNIQTSLWTDGKEISHKYFIV